MQTLLAEIQRSLAEIIALSDTEKETVDPKIPFVNTNTSNSKKKFGRRQRQRFFRKKRIEEEKEWTKEVRKQSAIIALRRRQAVTHIKYVLRTAYGFVADPFKTKRHNAYDILCNMPCWYYFGRPSNTAFHNFCEKDTKIPKNLKFLLGLGTKFIPTPFFTNHDMATTFSRLDRDLKLQTYFAGPESSLDNNDYDKKIYIASKWQPKQWMIPKELTYRFSRFRRKLDALFVKRRGASNLLPTQRKLLQTIRNHDDIIVVDCDKNLGPAIIERDKYALLVLEHLSDKNTYLRLNKEDTELYLHCRT